MLQQSYKKQVDNLLNTLWNDKDLDVIDSSFTSLSVIESPIATSIGGETKKTIISKWFTALPDVSYKTDIIIAEQNIVIANWTCSATHQGDFLGSKASGKAIRYKGTSTFKFSDNGKICYYHAIANFLDVLRSHDVEIEVNKKTNFKDPHTIIKSLKHAHGMCLSDQEIRILSFWLRSFTAKNIAIFFKISPKTVENHLSNIRHKLKLQHRKDIIEYLRNKHTYEMFEAIFYDCYIRMVKPNI